MKIVGVIPARYKSSRFPGKPLIEIVGVPMIIRVARIVEQALGKKHTYVATDDIRIQKLVDSYGYNVVMTPEHCLTGTDRIWEFSKQVEADIYINIQGDEPLLNFKDILRIAEVKERNYNYIINGMCSIGENENANSVNIPKVLVNEQNELIYMSRLPIPGIKDEKNGFPTYKKQVCIYGFNSEELRAFGERNKKSIFESYEDIEILRFFDIGIPIKMVETSGNSMAVDCPEDLVKVEGEILRLEKND